jgi:putative two-component system protein, hydrogenase maturation factor HypX/HoxX
VLARRGVVLNPHYKGMGGLHGSEYWTYTLPRRVGVDCAVDLTERPRPIGTAEAVSIGLVDDAFGDDVDAFERACLRRVDALANDPRLPRLLLDKRDRRIAAECAKPLARYRDEELARMRESFFGPDPAYHEARRRFVFKGAP